MVERDASCAARDRAHSLHGRTREVGGEETTKWQISTKHSSDRDHVEGVQLVDKALEPSRLETDGSQGDIETSLLAFQIFQITACQLGE